MSKAITLRLKNEMSDEALEAMRLLVMALLMQRGFKSEEFELEISAQ